MGIRRWIAPLLILLLGAGLRFHALTYDVRFHPDEALFATFARKAAVNGDWMLHGSLDKPPLSIYAEAISMMLVGARPLPNGVLTLDIKAGEFAARVPGTFASILLMAVMYALAKGLYGGKRTRQALSLQMPLVALFLMAVSPYGLAFSATAFTDGLMLLCIVLALCMASRGRWLWAGVWMALGYGCKQQALFYVPLVVGVGFCSVPRRTRQALSLRIARFALPVAICFGVLAVWDGARAQDTSLWTLAVANNEPGRLIYPEQALPRLQAWASYAANFAGTGWMTAILGGIAAAGVVWRVNSMPRERSTWIDVILAAYIVVYGLFHWLVALPTHDRYLLPVLPLVLLLMARGIEAGIKSVTQSHREAALRPKGTKTQRLVGISLGIFGCIAGLSFLPTAWDATEGRIGVGGDRGQHAGIDRLGAYLDHKPLGTIVYDHWLGWELGYYLGTWSDKRLTYYPTPDTLAADAAAQDDPAPRYFPVPRDVAVDPWLDRLTAMGFRIARDYESRNFVVYRLMPPK